MKLWRLSTLLPAKGLIKLVLLTPEQIKEVGVSCFYSLLRRSRVWSIADLYMSEGTGRSVAPRLARFFTVINEFILNMWEDWELKLPSDFASTCPAALFLSFWEELLFSLLISLASVYSHSKRTPSEAEVESSFASCSLEFMEAFYSWIFFTSWTVTDPFSVSYYRIFKMKFGLTTCYRLGDESDCVSVDLRVRTFSYSLIWRFDF